MSPATTVWQVSVRSFLVVTSCTQIVHNLQISWCPCSINLVPCVARNWNWWGYVSVWGRMTQNPLKSWVRCYQCKAEMQTFEPVKM